MDELGSPAFIPTDVTNGTLEDVDNFHRVTASDLAGFVSGQHLRLSGQATA